MIYFLCKSKKFSTLLKLYNYINELNTFLYTAFKLFFAIPEQYQEYNMVINWLDELDAAGEIGIIGEVGQLEKEKDKKKKKKKKKVVVKMMEIWRGKGDLLKILLLISVLNFLNFLNSENLGNNLNLQCNHH